MRVVIVANGAPLPESLLKTLSENSYVICADGGANHAFKSGITPNEIVGDLDSIAGHNLMQAEKLGVKITGFSRDKDLTDFEIALNHARDLNPIEIEIACALGRELDHTLGNLLATTREEYRDFSIRFIEDNSDYSIHVIRERTIYLFSTQQTERFSLIPITGKELFATINGAVWNLKNDSIPLGSTRGISNLSNSDELSISVIGGTALLRINRTASLKAKRQTL